MEDGGRGGMEDELRLMYPVWIFKRAKLPKNKTGVNLKGTLCFFGGTKKSNRTDRSRKKGRFEIRDTSILFFFHNGAFLKLK